MTIPIGVANSVSYNLDYDPVDTIKFMKQSNFDMIQIYINQSLIENTLKLKALRQQIHEQAIKHIYFHAEGGFNQHFLSHEYRHAFFNYLENFEQARVIYHFDEKEELDTMMRIVDEFISENRILYLENFFQEGGVQNAERNLRKYNAVFSLVNNFDVRIFPVIDIPRFFHQKLEFEANEALNWCYQVLNFFGNRRIPVLLHLIDAHHPAQDRNDFCPVGEGYIPYQQIFNFIFKNQVAVEGIILEYVDKINALKSRENLLTLLKQTG